MIQGGDPNTKRPEDPLHPYGTGGNVVDGREVRLKAEFNDIPHKRGVVSMARSAEPNSASSQFFIVVKESTYLDNKYSVFGEVVSGMEVVDEICSSPRDVRDRPNQTIAVRNIEVEVRDEKL
jgi:peptidyl-prolyl cis-trans isomerase B (cyclophilin B)